MLSLGLNVLPLIYTKTKSPHYSLVFCVLLLSYLHTSHPTHLITAHLTIHFSPYPSIPASQKFKSVAAFTSSVLDVLFLFPFLTKVSYQTHEGRNTSLTSDQTSYFPFWTFLLFPFYFIHWACVCVCVCYKIWALFFFFLEEKK